jgi:transposase
MDTEHSAITEPVRRIEVFTGTGRRRTWRAEDKAQIVAESVTSGESVCAVARRHGLSPQQLFGWRREAREHAAVSSPTEAPLFVPAVVEAPLPERTTRRGGRNRARQVDRISGIIEIEIDGVTVRVGRGAEAKTVTAVLRALKAGA